MDTFSGQPRTTVVLVCECMQHVNCAGNPSVVCMHSGASADNLPKGQEMEVEAFFEVVEDTPLVTSGAEFFPESPEHAKLQGAELVNPSLGKSHQSMCNFSEEDSKKEKSPSQTSTPTPLMLGANLAPTTWSRTRCLEEFINGCYR
ncbi:uncharacterized protein LOC132201217 [Neocloeon triangulifer]|uniref:uncharacterized protein LOC132201217 n=1 Tax=Neocloeon triangulifer TaxID=2078957 RepID=UPI00286F1940|nr:uncharacterized protein LOC132201217 [Neocloeon triangulifer]XP_059483188.1 uncharacterized protein LOC132201217 [Neocloeon triangulifer]